MKTRKLLYGFLVLGVLLSFCLSLINANSRVKLADYVVANCPYEDKFHPILNVAPGLGLNGRKLDKSEFIELIDYAAPACDLLWKRDFYGAEKEAALQCCTWAKGQSKTQIEAVLGQTTKRITSEDRPSLRQTTEIWGYNFGGNTIKMELVFEGNKCIDSMLSDHKDYFPYQPRESLKYHPILKVFPGQGLSQSKLDSRVYFKLKNYSINGSSSWFSEFIKAERQAALAFCNTVLGCSKQDVIRLVGIPRFKGGAVPGWSCCRPGTDTWLYSMGATSVNVRLVFEKNECIVAETYDEKDDNKYIRWREESLRSFAVGKTFQEIIAHEGAPFFVADRNTSGDGNVSPWGNETKLLYPHFPSAFVALVFEDGVCVRVQNDAIAG
jgi:hypothetical protein